MTQKEINQSEIPVIVIFSGEGCSPCAMVLSHLEKIQKEFPQEIKVIKLNVMEDVTLATTHRIQSIPTTLVFRDGKTLGRISGNPGLSGLRDFIQKTLRGTI